jgi:hypothetical protein
VDRLEVDVPMRAYRQLAHRIDEVLMQPDRCSDDQIILDGSSYRIERFANRHEASYRGGICPVPGAGTAMMLVEAFVCRQIDRNSLPDYFRRSCAFRIEGERDIIEELRLESPGGPNHLNGAIGRPR